MQKKKSRATDGNESIQYIDFSTVLWHGAELDKLKAHLTDHIDIISHYPERSAETICRLLSRRIEVKEDELLVTNGSMGAIHLVAQCFAGGKSLILSPTHTEIKFALECAGHKITVADGRNDISKLPFEGIEYCWLCTPNNPNGHLPSRSSLLATIKEHPEVTFIVDISMAAYATEETLKPSDIKGHKNLILTSSFSKAYSLPGLRVGYLVAKKDIIKKLKPKYTPRSVGSLAMEAIRFILIHPAQFTLPVRKWHRSATELISRLNAIDGIEVIPSAIPIFVARLRDGNAKDLHDYLIREAKIKIAIAEDDLDLAPNEFRINALDNESNKALTEAITAWMKRSEA